MDYVISDMHFDDDFLMKAQGEDFPNVADKNALIIANWNKKINDNNTKVYILGDIGFNRDMLKEIIPKLRGYKILLMGNHDSFSKSFYQELFDEVYDTPIYYSKRIVLSHHPIPVEPGVINLHGHTHLIDLAGGQHFNVCVERIDYAPRPMKYYEIKLGRIDKPNRIFLQEWYKDIQLATTPRDDLAIITASGLIDAELTKIKIAMKKQAKKRKLEHNEE